MSAERERALRLGMDRARREMLAGHDDALTMVEVERRLELEARRGFVRAVVEARAKGCSWEQIVHHVTGLGTAYGTEAAEKLFELVSVPGSHFGEDHVSWRCGACDSLVLDRGPAAGHPVDAEPGHREGCERLAAEVGRYVAGLADDQLTAGISGVVTDPVRELEAWDRPIELDEPGLELW